MQAGDLDQRVTLLEKGGAPNGMGGTTETWTAVATVAAKVVALNGREQVIAMQVAPATTYRVTIRSRSGVSEEMRLSWAGKTLDIRSAPPAQRSAFMTLTCEEIDT